MRRVSVAHHDGLARDTVTTADAQDIVLSARERSAQRLRDTPWRLNAHVSGPWLRQGPRALPPAARRPLDAALHRGAITLRGYDRVLRVAWTLADIAGRDAPTLHDIGRALLLKKGSLA